MKKIVFISWLLVGSGAYLFAQSSEILPTKSQVEWADSEIGVLIHYDINVFAPETYDPAKKETLPPLSVFNPSKLNTDQWLESAKKAGATYAVLVAKHGTGFCLWKTKVHEYHVGNTPFRGGGADIVADFINSCKKYGIKPGIYFNTNYNALYGSGIRTLSIDERLKYKDVVCKQLKELWSEYGKLFEIWFDGGVMVDKKAGIADEVSEMLKDYQPTAILFQGPVGQPNVIRWVGNEGGLAPYPNWSRADAGTSSSGVIEIPKLTGSPDGKYWIPGETDFPNRKRPSWQGGWLWKAGEDHLVFSPSELMDRFYTSVGRNSNMLIGMVIDTSGCFPANDEKAFADFGNMLKQRQQSIVGRAKGRGNEISIKFSIPQDINQIEIQEEITKGERIRAYEVEALVDGTWKKVCDGISVGHKRIQTFEKVKATSVRLNIKQSAEVPIIKNFAVYMF